MARRVRAKVATGEHSLDIASIELAHQLYDSMTVTSAFAVLRGVATERTWRSELPQENSAPSPRLTLCALRLAILFGQMYAPQLAR